MSGPAPASPEKPLVYIAGPYTAPDPCVNTHEAIKVANRIVDICVPLIPHLSHFWHTMTPQPYEFWTQLDLVLLSRCDAVLRFPGESPGADAEIAKALEWAIPVFYDEASLREYLPPSTRDTCPYCRGARLVDNAIDGLLACRMCLGTGEPVRYSEQLAGEAMARGELGIELSTRALRRIAELLIRHEGA